MVRKQSAIRKLKPGLSYRDACKLIKVPYQIGRRLLIKQGYRVKDGRKNPNKRRLRLLKEFAGQDWSIGNHEIAIERGSTREWIRQVREIVGAPKVETRGRKKLTNNGG